jgi:DNA-binding response OmpR family regulator
MQTLSSTQHQVSWLPDGDSARDAICGPSPRLRPRLLLLDVEMPGLDGFDILQALGKSGDLDNMSVIMLTRRTTTEDIVRARRLGAVDYLAKPVEAPLLLERVDRVLNQSPLPTR